MKPTIVIPALNPDGHLLQFMEQFGLLGGCAYRVVVVDDGSEQRCIPVFWRLEQEYGCTVLHHSTNRGKGAALKTGFAHLLALGTGGGCVTADADGQHSPGDVLALAQALKANPNALLLGRRSFHTKQVPFKSRWGNRLSALLFRAVTGVACPDTQTGLRGIPAGLLQTLCALPGERFEYEMNVLFYAARHKVPLRSIPIETIYRNNNSHSHFRALRDSARVYAGFARYGLSSLAGAAIDLTLFACLTAMLGGGATTVAAATVAARLASGCVNFMLNRRWVFKSTGSGRAEAGRYLELFVAQMALSALLVSLLSLLMPSLAAKVLVDTGLFIASYAVQRCFVFRRERPVPSIPERSEPHDPIF